MEEDVGAESHGAAGKLAGLQHVVEVTLGVEEDEAMREEDKVRI